MFRDSHAHVIWSAWEDYKNGSNERSVAILNMGGLLQYGSSDRPSHGSGPTRLNNDLPTKPSQESMQRAGKLRELFENFKVRY